jgi:hypothetical protein
MERNHRPDLCKGIGRDLRPMDCPPGFWLNRIVDWIRGSGLYVREENKNHDGRITKRAVRSNRNPTE